MSNVRLFPSTTFELDDDRAIELPIVDTKRRIEELALAHANSHYDFLEAIRAEFQTVAGFDLSLAEADALVDAVFLEYAKKKRTREAAFVELSRPQPTPLASASTSTPSP